MNKRIDPNLLAAAMATPDDNVTPPTRTQQAGLVAQISGLEVGEACSKLKKIDPTWSIARYAAEGSNVRELLRSSANSSVRVARARAGGEFDIEIADVTTMKRALYVMAIITRTA